MIHQAVAVWQSAEALVAPTGVTATRDGLDVLVDWNHAGGGGAIGFRVYRRSRSPGGSFGSYSFLALVTDETNTDFTDATAVGELEYQYRVHAWTGSVESAGAESTVVGAVSPITWQFGYPADYAPDDVSVAWGLDEAVDQSGLQVWWRDGASMGADPTATGALAYEGILTIGTINTGSEDNLVFIVARARYGTPGNYRYGPWSEERSATSRPRTPGVPASVTLTKTGPTEAELSWSPTAPLNADVFDVQYATRASSSDPWGAWTDPVGSPPTASPYTFDEIIEGNEYKMRVRARNTGGSSAYAESNSICVAGTPSTPTLLSVSTTGVADPESQLRITYSGDAGLSVEVRYRVEGTGVWLTNQGPDTDGSPFDLVGLTDGATFDVQIRTANLCGEVSAWTATVQGSTQAAIPDVPTGVVVTPVAGTSDELSIDWNDALNANTYDVQRAPDSGGSPGTWATIVSGVLPENVPIIDTGRTPNTRYHYRVRATNTGGSSAYSASAAGTTHRQAPASLNGTHNTADCPSIRVDLTWSNLNSAGNARSETMTLERSENGGSSWTTVDAAITPGATAYSDTGGSASTNRYRLKYNSETVWTEDPVLVDCPT